MSVEHIQKEDERNSILLSIKKMLGISPSYHAFDTDIIININSALMVLHQLGATHEVESITGEEETWEGFFQDNYLQAVKTYVYLRVRQTFDPPQTSFVLKAIEEQLRELEWRLNVQAEAKERGYQ